MLLTYKNHCNFQFHFVPIFILFQPNLYKGSTNCCIKCLVHITDKLKKIKVLYPSIDVSCTERKQ